MSEIIEISDLSLPELDVFSRLTEVQLRNKLDPTKGIFIAESATAINIALDAGFEPLSLLIERRRLGAEDGQKILERLDGRVPVYSAADSVLEKLTGYPLTRGIICAMRRKPLPNIEEVLNGARRIAVLEDVSDSTNIGAIFRSAAALGIDAVVVSHGCCDPLCRRSIRVSMGTIFLIPWTYIGESNEDWHKNGIAILHEHGYKTAAMALSCNSVSIDDSALQDVDRLAIIMGTEGTGLAPETIENSDFTVKIPMLHGVDSLNVAAASAVAFWQLRSK